MPELVHPSQLDPRLADLQRPQHSGFTAGLCRAVAQRWRVDPIIVRLAAVALALAGGIGFAVYIWGWLLTPRVGGQPPILRWLPAFCRWPQNTQVIAVAVSSLVVVLSTARQTGVAWGPVIIVGVLVWALARKRRKASATAPEPTATTVGNTGQAAGETVDQWRARLGHHTGAPLPTVDLYSPAPERPSTPTGCIAHRTSWWAAAAVLALSAVAAAVPFVFGLQPVLLWACVAAGGTAAVSLLVWSLVARTRRIPGALLGLALAAAMGSAMLTVSHSQAAAPLPLDPGAGTAQHSFVGEIDGHLDLTGLPTDTPATVTIDATASVVTVELAEAPGSVSVQSDTIHVEGPSYRGTNTAGRIDLVIEGDFSIVELEVAP